MSLSHEDVQEILRVLDNTDYNELTLESDNFTLTLRRGGEGWTQESSAAAGQQAPAASIGSAGSEPDVTEPAPTEDGLLEIRAPMVGTFYRAPKPGADPFIDIGSDIEDDTVIAIIEVMKLMNSIPAGVSGEIVEIHAEDAQFVEKGQLLMRVRPAEPAV